MPLRAEPWAAGKVVFRIVFNERQQCHFLPLSTRAKCLTSRRANGLQLPYKQEVAGSSPALPTNYFHTLG
jgi:hypothetical protein